MRHDNPDVQLPLLQGVAPLPHVAVLAPVLLKDSDNARRSGTAVPLDVDVVALDPALYLTASLPHQPRDFTDIT